MTRWIVTTLVLFAHIMLMAPSSQAQAARSCGQSLSAADICVFPALVSAENPVVKKPCTAYAAPTEVTLPTPACDEMKLERVGLATFLDGRDPVPSLRPPRT
jgi:hypothetical protein